MEVNAATLLFWRLYTLPFNIGSTFNYNFSFSVKGICVRMVGHLLNTFKFHFSTTLSRKQICRLVVRLEDL